MSGERGSAVTYQVVDVLGSAYLSGHWVCKRGSMLHPQGEIKDAEWRAIQVPQSRWDEVLGQEDRLSHQPPTASEHQAQAPWGHC